MDKYWQVPIREIGQFFVWWGKVVPQSIFSFTKEVLLNFEDSLQFGANFRLWLSIEPMFGDYTWSGRAVGFLIRGLRVIFTVFMYCLILAGGVLIILGWIMLPFWALFKVRF